MSRPAPPRLLVIADHEYAGGDHAWLRSVRELALTLEEAATTALQLRVKCTDPEIRANLLRRAMVSVRGLRVPVMVNGTVEEARGLGSDGVHWAEEAIPREPVDRPTATRPAMSGEPALLGASTHSIDALRRAGTAGADFALFGPVFAPGSKSGRGRGLGALREAVAGAPVPVLALGGIDVNRVRACLEVGCHGVAVVSAARRGNSPHSAVRELLAALARGP